MRRRRTMAAGLAAVLSVGSVTPVLAQEPEDLAELEAERTASHTLTGTVTFVADEGVDRGEYYLELEDGSTVELDAGPPWYWGEDHPLAGLVGMSVEAAGHLKAARPGAAVSPDGSLAHVIREAGPPPWAGAPSWASVPWAAGPEHPGHQGWSRGQAMSVATSGRPDADQQQAEE